MRVSKFGGARVVEGLGVGPWFWGGGDSWRVVVWVGLGRVQLMGPQLEGEGDSRVPDLGYLVSPLFQGVLGKSHRRGTQNRRGFGVLVLKGTLGIPIFW